MPVHYITHRFKDRFNCRTCYVYRVGNETLARTLLEVLRIKFPEACASEGTVDIASDSNLSVAVQQAIIERLETIKRCRETKHDFDQNSLMVQLQVDRYLVELYSACDAVVKPKLPPAVGHRELQEIERAHGAVKRAFEIAAEIRDMATEVAIFDDRTETAKAARCIVLLEDLYHALEPWWAERPPFQPETDGAFASACPRELATDLAEKVQKIVRSAHSVALMLAEETASVFNWHDEDIESMKQDLGHAVRYWREHLQPGIDKLRIIDHKWLLRVLEAEYDVARGDKLTIPITIIRKPRTALPAPATAPAAAPPTAKPAEAFEWEPSKQDEEIVPDAKVILAPAAAGAEESESDFNDLSAATATPSPGIESTPSAKPQPTPVEAPIAVSDPAFVAVAAVAAAYKKYLAAVGGGEAYPKKMTAEIHDAHEQLTDAIVDIEFLAKEWPEYESKTYWLRELRDNPRPDHYEEAIGGGSTAIAWLRQEAKRRAKQASRDAHPAEPPRRVWRPTLNDVQAIAETFIEQSPVNEFGNRDPEQRIRLSMKCAEAGEALMQIARAWETPDRDAIDRFMGSWHGLDDNGIYRLNWGAIRAAEAVLRRVASIRAGTVDLSHLTGAATPTSIAPAVPSPAPARAEHDGIAFDDLEDDDMLADPPPATPDPSDARMTLNEIVTKFKVPAENVEALRGALRRLKPKLRQNVDWVDVADRGQKEPGTIWSLGAVRDTVMRYVGDSSSGGVQQNNPAA